jgi:Yip1 domain
MAATAAALASRHGFSDDEGGFEPATAPTAGGETGVEGGEAATAPALPAFEDFSGSAAAAAAAAGSIPDGSLDGLLGPVPVGSIEHDQTTQQQQQEQLGDESSNNQGSKRPWDVGYYAFLFDVSTAQVLRRLGGAAVPYPARLLPSMVGEGFSGGEDDGDDGNADFGSGGGAAALLPQRGADAGAEVPDLYGPFWIASTLVALLPAAGGMGAYLESVFKDTQERWEYDEAKLGSAASLLYGYIGFVPLVLWGILRWMRSGLRLAEIACTYGYSLFLLVPAALVSIVPTTAVRYIAFALAALLSSAYIVVNFGTVLRRHRFKPVLLGMGAVHAAFILVCGAVFFGSW